MAIAKKDGCGGTTLALEPILCAPLLRVVDRKLLDLLSSLDAREWDLPTIALLWKVRDVAAHLLDTALRKLAMVRDRCLVEAAEIKSADDLVELVNRLNREGVTVYRRLSPPVLIDMMRLACEQSAAFHEELDPFAPAAFPVSWAGEKQSLNWFDTARELTERWHHQQQIRLATNRPGIMTSDLYRPVLECFMRGLSHHFRDVDAAAGTVVQVQITGESGGNWFLARRPNGWVLEKLSTAEIAAKVSLPEDVAWRLFTKGIHREAALSVVQIDGNPALGSHVLKLTAIVG